MSEWVVGRRRPLHAAGDDVRNKESTVLLRQGSDCSCGSPLARIPALAAAAKPQLAWLAQAAVGKPMPTMTGTAFGALRQLGGRRINCSPRPAQLPPHISYKKICISASQMEFKGTSAARVKPGSQVFFGARDWVHRHGISRQTQC